MSGHPPPIENFFVTPDLDNKDLADEWASLTPDAKYWACQTLKDVSAQSESGIAYMPLEGRRALLMTYRRVGPNHVLLKRVDFLERLVSSREQKRNSWLQPLYYAIGSSALILSGAIWVIVHSGHLPTLERWLGNTAQATEARSIPSPAKPSSGDARLPKN